MKPSTRLLLFLILAISSAASAQPLFESDEVLEIELSGPLHTLIKNKHDDPRVEKPFKLSAEGVQHEIEVRVRGKSRINLCSFPPLRLNFDTDSTEGSVFSGQDKLKLVTHCSTSSYAEADVMEEYAAYRIFNLLSETSYRVRPLRIHYHNTEGRVAGIDEPRYGFLIESKESLAERAGSNTITAKGVKLSRLDQERAALMYLFQYLVGNTDWSLARAHDEDFCCHNVTLLCLQDFLVPVPYDLDMSGLVNAKYAKPHPNLRRLKRVTQRLYRGHCTEPENLRTALRHIVQRREDIGRIIEDLPGVQQGTKKKKHRFLDSFFKEAEKEDEMIEKFVDDCIK